MFAKFTQHPNPLIRRCFKIATILVVWIITAWLVGLLWFSEQIPKTINYSKYSDADAIVVLTGGRSRLDSGFYLFKSGYADKLFISGVKKGTSLKILLSSNGFGKGEIAEILADDKDIILGFEAQSTRSNAEEVKNWIKNNNYKKVYLVTANYHMPRSLLEFKAEMPDKVFYTYPVFPEDFKLDRWWSNYGSFRLIASEYNKYLLAALRRLFHQ